MNTDVMFSSKTDLWETPQEFFDALDAEFHFTLDLRPVGKREVRPVLHPGAGRTLPALDGRCVV